MAKWEAINTLNGFTFLSLSGIRLDQSNLKLMPNFREEINLSQRERNKPTPKIITNIGVPQTKPLIRPTNSVIASIQTS